MPASDRQGSRGQSRRQGALSDSRSACLGSHRIATGPPIDRWPIRPMPSEWDTDVWSSMRLSFGYSASAAGGCASAILAVRADAQGQPPSPRPGLTAQQTKQAVELAQGAMVELRKKTEGAAGPDADRREYVVGVELLVAKEPTASRRRRSRTPRRSAKQPEKQKERESDRNRPPGPCWSPRIAISTISPSFRRSTWGPAHRQRAGRPAHAHPALRRRIRGGQGVGAREERGSQEALRAIRRKAQRRSPVQPVHVKDDPRTHRVVHLNYRIGKQGPELSPPPSRPDDARGRDPAPENPSPSERRRRRADD